MLLKFFNGGIFKTAAIIYTFVFISSCKNDRTHIDVSAIPVVVRTARFEEDLFTGHGENISFLKNKYGNFFDLFCFKLTETGIQDVQLLKNRLRDFTTDADLSEIFNASEKKYKDFSAIDHGLTDAFRHYRYYFPLKAVPHVISFISGFNYGIVSADSMLGIGLDMYLGSDAKYYPSLQFPQYKIRRMRSEYIVSDGLRGWAESEWEQDPAETEFAGRLIHSGKMLFLLDLLMPEVSDTIKTGYTGSQLTWCRENEKNIWSFFVDQKMMFSTDQNLQMKFLNDGPTTSGLPKESPGGIGQWTGWKIVQAYMRNNPEVSLSQLMSEKDYRKILRDSKYKPGK